MRRHYPMVLGFCSVLLSGCVDPVLVKVGYPGPVTHTSAKRAAIALSTGVVEGGTGTTLIYTGQGIVVPVATGSDPSKHFNSQDQRVFVDSLKEELQQFGTA